MIGDGPETHVPREPRRYGRGYSVRKSKSQNANKCLCIAVSSQVAIMPALLVRFLGSGRLVRVVPARVHAGVSIYYKQKRKR
jgi:hypothetical protein